jgi:small-conductance mechanosensitive channel
MSLDCTPLLPLAAVLLLCLAAGATPVLAAGAAAPHAPIGDGQPQPDDSASLNAAVADTLALIAPEIEALREQRDQAAQLDNAVAAAIKAYHARLQTVETMLLFENTALANLQRGWATLHSIESGVQRYLEEISAPLEEISAKRVRIAELYAMWEKQLMDLQLSPPSMSVKTTQLVYNLNYLLERLKEGKDLIKELHAIHQEKSDQLRELQKTIGVSFAGLDRAIEQMRWHHLFQRRATPLVAIQPGQIRKEVLFLVQRLRLVGGDGFLVDQVRQLARSDALLHLPYLILLAIFWLALFRFRNWLGERAAHEAWQEAKWRRLAALLFQKTFLLTGATLAQFIFVQVEFANAGMDLAHVVGYLLGIFLFTRWPALFVRHAGQTVGDVIPETVGGRVNHLIALVRVFASAYVVVLWLVGELSALAALLRLLFETLLFFWSVSCVRALRQRERTAGGGGHPYGRRGQTAAALLYLVAGGALVLALAGYGPLSAYWCTAWGTTALVLLWSWIVSEMLVEWGRQYRSAPETFPAEPAGTSHALRWTLLRLCWGAWALGTLVLLFAAWGGWQAVSAWLFRLLSHKVSIGNIRLNLLGIGYGVLVLFFTHLAVRILRDLLKKKLLASSGMEPGLRDSIVAIASYVAWMIGILIAMNAVGFSTTSLTVAFGALGVGLGFGLQAIFNNFISGLILLFERPIQVGDAVEVNGIWGEVKKINVRSTVVQTYDNASLIIPNSEFISKQVTNWSFKDKRLRRKLSVGVAYGSDVRLVHETLMEIAGKTENVLKYPQPNVVFIAHGESTLDFMLRYWTFIDYYYATETEIRFEIERLFKERGIVIAFPQRDVHLHPADVSPPPAAE